MSHLQSRQRITARKHSPDYGVVLIAGLLLLIGLIVLFSLGPALQESTGISVSKQFIAIFASTISFAATAFIPITFWHRAQPILILATVLASFALLFAPEVNGAARWIPIGSFSFQPSELLKFSFIIYLATFLSKRERHKTLDDMNETLIPISVVLALLGLFVVFFQKDLGTMLVIVSIFLGMIFIAGLKLRHILALASALVGTGVLAVLLVPHRLARLATFLDPGSDLDGAGYHINQALIAVGSGGILGLGLGGSIQAYGYLPEAANDSIFAVYAEKFGFVGSVFILALFAALLIRMIRIVERAPNSYTRLLATGVFAWIFSHIVINTGAMLGLLPLTGITLPLLSYGGSSLVFIMAALGLIFNISRYSHFESNKRKGARLARSSNRRGHGRTRYAH